MHNSLISLLVQYGYPAIFIGGIFEGESVILIGGLAAHQGLLSLPLIYLYAVLGALTGDISWFMLGRKRGNAIIHKWPVLQKLTARPVKAIHRHPKLLAFAMRFMYGFRHVVPFSLGFSKIPTPTFLILNLCGALVWAGVVMGAGYLLGGVIEELFGHIKRMEFVIIALLIFGFGAYRAIGSTIGVFMKEKFEEK